MSLEGLLTYFGLLVAALAIMGPIQRHALGLFIPKWFLPISAITALLVLLIFRDMPLVGINTRRSVGDQTWWRICSPWAHL